METTTTTQELAQAVRWALEGTGNEMTTDNIQRVVERIAASYSRHAETAAKVANYSDKAFGSFCKKVRSR